MLLVFSLASASLCAAQWATQPLQNTLSWNSLSSGLSSGLNAAQLGYPLLGNRLAAGSFGYGTGSLGTVGATQLGAFGTTDSFGGASSFPLNALGGMFGANTAATSLLAPSGYPMGNVMFPAVTPTQPPPDPATVGGSSPGETKKLWNQQWAEQQDSNVEAYYPEYRWEEYKNSFVVTAGVPSNYNDNVARALLSMDKWYTAILGTEMFRSLKQPFNGASAPRFDTFPVPGSPSMPVIPCPRGTPQYVCEKAAENFGMQFPTPPGLDEDEAKNMEYAYYQNLMQRRYPGYGPVYPRAPINGQPFRQVGPNPGPFAPRAPLNCEIELDYAFTINNPGSEVFAKENEFVAEVMYACPCTPTGLPVVSQCTKRVIEEHIEEVVEEIVESDVLDATVVGATGALGAKMIYGLSFPSFPANVFVEQVTPCGNFAVYNPNVPCLTVLAEGFTPEPPLRISGPQSAQPQRNGGGPWITDPYACNVYVFASYYFDSPFAWENNYDAEYFIGDSNTLECLCDQFDNPILNSCRQGVQDLYPVVPSGPVWKPPSSDDDDDDAPRRREARENGEAPAASVQENKLDRAVRLASEAAEVAMNAAEYAVNLAKNAERLAKINRRRGKKHSKKHS